MSVIRIVPPRRRDDWPERLAALLKARAALPFAWGSNDCCLFVCDAVQAMTGADPAAHIRGTYRDVASAAAVVASLGGVPAIAAAAFGAPLDNLLLAGRGDIALLDGPLGETLGVVLGRDVAVATPEGLRGWPLKHCRNAWRI